MLTIIAAGHGCSHVEESQKVIGSLIVSGGDAAVVDLQQKSGQRIKLLNV